MPRLRGEVHKVKINSMNIRTLKQGSTGPAVLKWETFLCGVDLLTTREVDMTFDEATHEATFDFQTRHGLYADGVAGKKTIGYAIDQLGFEYRKIGEGLVKKPRGIKALSSTERSAIFGDIQFRAAGTPRNPEAIKITNGWQKQNLGAVVIPQLKGVRGAPKSGRVFFHKKGCDQLKAMFQAWEDAGLMHHVLTWGGSWVPRFIRGSRATLSNHAYATAFDINVPWNGLGRTPAALGEQGSVQELLEIAVKFGFYNGSWFSSRPDGMHFELMRIL